MHPYLASLNVLFQPGMKNQSTYEMAGMMVSALENELSEAISNQANDDHKTPDSV